MGQRTQWPVHVTKYDGVGGCSFNVQIQYCWLEDPNEGVKLRRVSWTMGPGTTTFDPIALGFETTGEFSPETPTPIVSLTINGVVIDVNNQCACFQRGNCCMKVCLTATAITIDYFSCSGSSFVHDCTVFHPF